MIVEDRGLLGIQGRRLYRVQLHKELGEASTFEVPENELETGPPPVRLSYKVKYIRPDNTNVWHASTGKERVLKGVKAKGAVAYITTPFYEGERADDQRHAAVQVLLESIHTSTKPHSRRLQASCVSSPTARGPWQTRCFYLDIRVQELNTQKTARTRLS